MTNEEEAEDDDAGHIGVGKYPCLPSLVALQQMRNRVHLAYLGKKLMKWTAMATVKELRKISIDLHQAYKNFPHDTTEGFILLARARYFCPNLNKMVLENPEEKAAVTVLSSYKAVTSVKTLTYDVKESNLENTVEVKNGTSSPTRSLYTCDFNKFALYEHGNVDTDQDHYEHLGIEKGGQIILEVKQMWRNILKKMISIVELRHGFESVEMARNSATKLVSLLITYQCQLCDAIEFCNDVPDRLDRIRRVITAAVITYTSNTDLLVGRKQNVLGKIVIPRTQATIKYILLELEEMAREELFRTKKIVQAKLKRKEKLKQLRNVNVSGVCSGAMKAIEEKFPKPKVVEIASKPQPTKELKPPKEIELEQPKRIVSIKPEFVLVTPQEPLRTLLQPEMELSYKPEDGVYATLSKESTSSKAMSDRVTCETGQAREDGKIDYLKKQLSEVISQSKLFMERQLSKLDLSTFLRSCEDLRHRMEQFFKKHTESDDIVESNLDNLNTRIRDVVQESQKLKERGVDLSESLEDFVKKCKETEIKINTYVRNQEPVGSSTSRIQEWKDLISEIESLTKEYRCNSQTTPAVQEFLESCKNIKMRIDSYSMPKRKTEEVLQIKDINYLSEQLSNVQVLAEMKTEGMSSTSVDIFVTACKDFKKKLAEYIEQSKELSSGQSVKKLIRQINEAISLSKEAKTKGYISESVEDFIKSCENIKLRLQEKDKERKKKAAKKLQPPILKELKNNINDVMDLVSELRVEGFTSESVENFVKSCETAKDKIELSERFPPNEDDDPESMIIYPICGKSCTCKAKENPITDSVTCSKCEDIMNNKDEEKLLSVRKIPPICNTCSDASDKESVQKPSQQLPRVECPEPKLTSRIEEPPPDSDPPLGLFEKKIKQIVKITRTRNKDGTVREEKEIITIKEESHNPNEINLHDVDLRNGASNGPSMGQGSSNRTVGLCVVPDLSRGFMPPFRNVSCLIRRRNIIDISQMNNNKETCSQEGENLESCLDQLRYHLSQVVEKSNNLRPNADLSPSYENFLQICNEVHKKLHIHDPAIRNKQNTDDTERCLDKICDCTSDAEQSEEESKKQQLLSSCKQIKVKMEGKKSDEVKKTNGSDKDKQGDVQVNTALTTSDSKNEGLFGYVKKMISDRQLFKATNECENKELPSSDDPISKIVDQLNKTQNLAKEAKNNGCMSDSLEEFIKSCEKLKQKLIKKRLKMLNDNTKVSNEENISDLITQLKAIALVSDSIETFLRAQLTPQLVREKDILENKDKVTSTSVETTLFSKHTEILDDATGSGVPVCHGCQKNNQNNQNEDMNIKIKEKTEPAECCQQKYPELCESNDNSLGLFVKNVHKIVKVTRTLKDDGNVLEKKKVTVIKRNRHDPKETHLAEVCNINDDSDTIVEKTITTIKKQD